MLFNSNSNTNIRNLNSLDKILIKYEKRKR